MAVFERNKKKVPKLSARRQNNNKIQLDCTIIKCVSIDFKEQGVTSQLVSDFTRRLV